MRKPGLSVGEFDTHSEPKVTPRRLGIGLLGLVMLSGCADSADMPYLPDSDATCTVIAAQAFEPNYEADRWADTGTESDRLVGEISGTIENNGEFVQYAVCIDDDGTAHAAGVDHIERVRQYFGEHDHGIDFSEFSVPALLSPTDFEAQFQTEIDPGHGF